MPTVLITGCSSGLGAQLAQASLDAGLAVIATARRADALADLKAKGANTEILDVTAPKEDLVKFAAKVIEKYGPVEYLINNAGFLIGGALEETTHEQNYDQFNVNFFGVLNLTGAFLPYFRKQRSGTIVNIGSQGGVLCISGGGIYGATKAAIDLTSEVWSKELEVFNVSCMSVCLGAFKTEVAAKLQAADPIDGYTRPHEWLNYFKERGGQERGDAGKAAAKIVHLMQQKEKPLRFTLGEDAVNLVRDHYKGRLQELEKWAGTGKGTDRDDYAAQDSGEAYGKVVGSRSQLV